MGGRSIKDVGGAGFAGSSPPFLGRERAAVDTDVGPEMMMMMFITIIARDRERWVLLKRPRRDIDGVGEGK